MQMKSRLQQLAQSKSNEFAAAVGRISRAHWQTGRQLPSLPRSEDAGKKELVADGTVAQYSRWQRINPPGEPPHGLELLFLPCPIEANISPTCLSTNQVMHVAQPGLLMFVLSRGLERQCSLVSYRTRYCRATRRATVVVVPRYAARWTSSCMFQETVRYSTCVGRFRHRQAEPGGAATAREHRTGQGGLGVRN